MALTPGTRLGPYDIVALIGVGGMREVYKARDPRLDRDVAIKFCPPNWLRVRRWSIASGGRSRPVTSSC